MKVRIKDAENLSNSILQKLGFSKKDSQLITQNLIDGELVNKKSHGLIRIPAIKRKLDEKKINAKEKTFVIKETDTLLYLDGKYRPGFIVIYESLDKAIKKAKKSGVVVVGLKDLGYASGFIGSYARIAAKNDLIFIAFNNSPGGLVPHGSTDAIWGTNPLTVGVPAGNKPVILDMASSKTTWGDLMVVRNEGRSLKKGIAIDSKGNPTVDPTKAMEGGILPIGEHKGSGIAFIVELLAGALTGSMVGGVVSGGWGTSYILIDPSKFRPLKKFKSDVKATIAKLKESTKAKGFSEINFPGERSFDTGRKNLDSGEMEINKNLWSQLENLNK